MAEKGVDADAVQEQINNDIASRNIEPDDLPLDSFSYEDIDGDSSDAQIDQVLSPRSN